MQTDNIEEYGLTSHSTHYRSFRGRFYGSDDQPTMSYTEGWWLVNTGQGPIQPGPVHQKVK